MASVNPLYLYPRYYDIIFARDVGPEVDFLCELFARLRGRRLNAMVELGCGPGYHVGAFVERGVHAFGLDGSEHMIEYARSRAGEDVEPRWLLDDMRSFTLPQPVDLAVCLFDSIDGLCTIDDFVAHFEAVAGSLVPDGLYVIGQSHQREAGIIGYGPFHYSAEREGCSVTLDWAGDVRTDTLTQTADVDIVLRVREAGVEQEYRHRTTESFATPLFLQAVARLSGGLEPWLWFGDYRLDQAYDDTPDSPYCISVWRKPGT